MKKFFDRQFLGIALGLVCVTLAAYWPVLQADFVNYDDQHYVTANASVQSGLTWAGVKWAFTTGKMGSWHPVTWLSHMADVQVFGMDPRAHHAVNLILHLANVLLLLVLFRRLTGHIWPSALAAGLFALHPLHVESVAWVAERKDVLSVFFGLLSLLAYTRYAQAHPFGSAWTRPRFGTGRHVSQSDSGDISPHSKEAKAPSFDLRPLISPWYWLALLFLALGLMSKPMLVTLPFLMLLLDVWPLNRITKPSSIFHLPSSKKLLLEKLPFFVVIGIVAVVTVFTQQASEAVMSLQDFPFTSRLGNVMNSLMVYVTQFFWPTDLAPFYPFVKEIGFESLVVAGVVVVGLTVLAVVQRKQSPWLAVGWFWYLISLLPVCGLVQVGLQAHADRYTYLPSIGLSIAVVWGIANISGHWRGFAGMACVAVLGIMGWRTHIQSRLWQGSEPLFRHALAVTQGNFMAHQGLAEELLQQGKMGEAREHFLTALAINPRMPSVRNNIAVLLLRDGKYSEAIEEFRQVLIESPSFQMAHFNLADAYERTGQPAEALLQYQKFLAHQPEDLEARMAVARCLSRLGKPQGALDEFRLLRQNYPANVAVSAALAAQWQFVGNVFEAIAEYERSLTLAPNSPELCNNLAWLLATHADPKMRSGPRAVQLAEHACQLTSNRQPLLIGTLAAAYAEAGRFDDAVKAVQRAIDQATASKQSELAVRNAELLELYRARKPYHEPVQAGQTK